MTELLIFSPSHKEGAELVNMETPASSADLAFIRCVERLEELIDAETGILKSCERLDFESFNLRKTHALLEFTRVARNLPSRASAQARRRLGELVEKLAANTEALEQHLQAMQEITGLIVESIRRDESDGTYSMRGAARR